METMGNEEIISLNASMFPPIIVQDFLYWVNIWAKISSMKSLIFKEIIRKGKFEVAIRKH